MKLSRDTMKILKNFSSINTSLVIREGAPLRTITSSKSILASADVEEEFTVTAGIYDLPEFLGILGLFKDPDLEWNENSVTITEGGTTVEYIYCDPEMIVSIDKEPKFPEGEDTVEFDITREQLSQVMKGANTMSLTDLRIRRSDNGDIVIGAADSKGAVENTIEVVVGKDERDVDYEMMIAVDNVRVNSDYNYHVRASFKGLTHWSATNSSHPLNFYIGSSQNPKPHFTQK